MAVNETLIAESITRGITEGLSGGVPEAAFFFMLPLIMITLLLSILVFVAWLWMIIDCAKRNRFRSGDRVVWILLLVLVGPIGMLLYYFMVMRK
ncbi:MAG: PLDc N-terminal domain-containing protein [Candidatus Aenigmarchaeota archaeon]|nr:PLDc N-terminal domain-containing protein [Candidatus Aenigmarchaeota archaeon]